MLSYVRILPAAFALLLFLSATESTFGASLSGRLHGSNTVDKVFKKPPYPFAGDKVTYTVRAYGHGSNQLRVRVQQRDLIGRWVTLRDFKMDVENPANVVTDTYTVLPLVPGPFRQIIRYKFSRKIGTSYILWSVTD